MDIASSLQMSNQDLYACTDALLDFLKGKRDNLVVTVNIENTQQEAFNAKEITHMEDVRTLYRGILSIRIIAFVVFLISILYYTYYIVHNKNRRKNMLFTGCSSFLKTIGVTLLILILFAGWAFVDFESFWHSFHRLVFSNDLWLLDPMTDLLINLFPAEFFFKLICNILIAFWGSIFILAAICILVVFRFNPNKKEIRKGRA